MNRLHTERHTLYLAAPLFSTAERSFNAYLKVTLSGLFNVYLPQEDGALMPTLLASGHSPQQASRIVFANDTEAIRRADVVLVVLDGRSIDEGACFELGFAYAMGKECVGLQTDFRRLAPFVNNPMVSGALSHVFADVAELMHWATESARRHEGHGEGARREGARSD